MPRLPKAIIKKYGITKKAWSVYRGEHHSSVGKTRMPKRKRSYGRLRRAKRRFHAAKVPFEVLIAGASIPFTPATSGIGSPFELIQHGDINSAVMSFKKGFLGIDPWHGNSWNFAALINPMDMETGRYTKMLIGSALIGMVRRKITGKYTNALFKKIPLIGRFVN